MLKHVRQAVVQNLWETYRSTSVQAQRIEAGLKQQGIQKLILDHFAIIDLPGPYSGIPQLSQIFTAIGYTIQGKDYLAEKQNDFLWLTESDSFNSAAVEVLPQVVVADFRLDELPIEIRRIIEKYSHQSQPFLMHEAEHLVKQAESNDQEAAKKLTAMITQYFAGRDWPLPTTLEFQCVHEFNELLAWVLIFGRKPNHFTLSIHLLNHFTDLADFHHFIEHKLRLPLNQEGSIIKGGQAVGISQGSTLGLPQIVSLSDGHIELPEDFVEFVWRYPNTNAVQQQPFLWKDYFTGFIAKHADRVIESLYVNE